jgi:NADPH2 dehydrogenase
MSGLSDPLEVKGLMLKNRIVMPPMQISHANSRAPSASAEGAVTEGLVEHYVRRSKALGLLIVEHNFVSSSGRYNKRQLGIHDDSLIPGLERLSSSVNAKATPVVIQISHAGGKASMGVTGIQPVAPSTTGTARMLRVDEIESLVEVFALAAERAMRAGFDGVEVHGAHGYLLNQFFSPITNRRSDEYGGSLENRMRFPLEVVERVREKVGGRLLLYRLGADDLDPGGVQIEDSKKFAVELEKAGVDIIDVSGGLCASSPPSLQGIQGYFIPQAQEIKKAVNTPVIGVGGITEPEYADKLIREERVDLVAVGRALLKDPDWAVKAIETLSKS